MYIRTYVNVLNSTILHVKLYKDICVPLLLRPCQGDWACFFFRSSRRKTEHMCKNKDCRLFSKWRKDINKTKGHS